MKAELARYKKTPPRDPSTPSGAIPPYEKENSGRTGKGKKGTGKKGKKRGKKPKPGRKKGHAGACRPTPDHVDAYDRHSLCGCPNCGSANLTHRSTRTRYYTEDIPPVTPIVTERSTIEGGYCEDRKKSITPFGDRLRCDIGNAQP